jgi:two-component system, OmpR family, sensor histidine kinase MtrB
VALVRLMRQRHLGLRAILTTTTVAVVLLCLGVSVSLVLFTGRLHEASRDLADAVESLQLASDAKMDLLVHGRTGDAGVRRDIEARLKRTFADLAAHVTTEAEREGLWRASYAVDRYITATHARSSPPEAATHQLDAAYDALESMVEVNVEVARNARKHVAQLDSLADTVGIGAALALLVLAAWLLWWLRSRAFRPVFALLESMERFGRGDRLARAEESGPAELQALAKRFNEMASALAAQRDAQMSFLGGVAHDIRNPLAALRLSMSSAQAAAPGILEARFSRTFALAERQITRIERMLGDLMDTAKIEAGKLDLRLDWRDARGIVSEVTAQFEATSPANRLIVDLPDEEVWLRCDPLRMEQVLSNLLSNAIKYSPEAGDVRVTLVREPDEIILSVADQGIGISTEDQARLFEPFRRVGSPTGAVPGAGLGLFVVRQIVLAHGGRIDVASARGSGSTFRVRLPVVASPGNRTIEGDVHALDGPSGQLTH